MLTNAESVRVAASDVLRGLAAGDHKRDATTFIQSVERLRDALDLPPDPAPSDMVEAMFDAVCRTRDGCSGSLRSRYIAETCAQVATRAVEAMRERLSKVLSTDGMLEDVIDWRSVVVLARHELRQALPIPAPGQGEAESQQIKRAYPPKRGPVGEVALSRCDDPSCPVNECHTKRDHPQPEGEVGRARDALVAVVLSADAECDSWDTFGERVQEAAAFYREAMKTAEARRDGGRE